MPPPTKDRSPVHIEIARDRDDGLPGCDPSQSGFTCGGADTFSPTSMGCIWWTNGFEDLEHLTHLHIERVRKFRRSFPRMSAADQIHPLFLRQMPFARLAHDSTTLRRRNVSAANPPVKFAGGRLLEWFNAKWERASNMPYRA